MERRSAEESGDVAREYGGKERRIKDRQSGRDEGPYMGKGGETVPE